MHACHVEKEHAESADALQPSARECKAQANGFLPNIGWRLFISDQLSPLSAPAHPPPNRGIKVDGRLFISDRAHLLFDLHKVRGGEGGAASS